MRRLGACLVSVAFVGCGASQDGLAFPDAADATETDAGSLGPAETSVVEQADVRLDDGTDDVRDDALDADAIDGASATCDPRFVGDGDYTCSSDGTARGECIDGVGAVESCARGCLRVASGPDVCIETTTSWSCTGSYSTVKATDGDYYLTAFGCWTDAAGSVHTDPGDNCIPGCLSKAKSLGLCVSTDTGPQCEEKVSYYVADSGRFGCGARVRVTNPANGKAVVAVVLDAGPSCSVEAKVSKAVLDASGLVNRALFGTDEGYSDKALVHVVEVDGSTPLGPI